LYTGYDASIPIPKLKLPDNTLFSTFRYQPFSNLETGWYSNDEADSNDIVFWDDHTYYIKNVKTEKFLSA
jgi:hypothetical protein